MAVESFIPLYDVKITIEKPVKPKPSITDLTTIESPGKIMVDSNTSNYKKYHKLSMQFSREQPLVFYRHNLPSKLKPFSVRKTTF